MKRVTDGIRKSLPSGERIGLIPTMGALHAGHISLVDAIRPHCDVIVMSIFVNPLQFNSATDLARYPRTEDADAVLAAEAGVDLLWIPEQSEIYPGETTLEEAGWLGEIFEGVHRPGHFAGMLTVVRRLFELVNPAAAIFGEKDFQQLALIRQMVREHSLPLEILAGPTIRESDGLAMASRNRFIEQRDVAARIPAALRHLQKSSKPASLRLVEARNLLDSPLEVEYLELIDPLTWAPISDDFRGQARAILAASLDGVRLIDNDLVEIG